MRQWSGPPAQHLVAAVGGFVLIAAVSTLAFGTLTPIWFSNAIAVVALLVHPPRTWPWFLVPMVAGDAACLHFFGHGPALLLAGVDLLEILLAALVIRATGGIRFPVFEGAQVARVVVTALLVPVVSASCAAWALQATVGVPFATGWRAWYSATALGLLIVTPFLLCWLDPGLRAQLYARATSRRAAVLAAGVLLVGWLAQTDLHEALFLLAFPVLFVLTWFHGLAGATLGMSAIGIALLWATPQGHGGIAHMLAGETLLVQIEAAQVFLAALLLSSLPLAVLRLQQAQLEERLRRAGEARTEFLAAMSHEIRTPMTGVLGIVDLLATEPLTPRQQRYVEALRSSGRHLLSVINDILDFTRIETGRLELEEVDFPLGDVLERVRSLAHPLAVERGLALQVEEDHRPEQLLRGDPLRLRQVLLNLVSNAIKFTDQGSVSVAVTRSAQEDGRQRVAFEVRDTGVGIPPEKIEGLFGAFTQADRSISRRYGGSGLGLAISKRLVEAMGGEIGVESAPRQGSVFRFAVPLKAGDARGLRTQRQDPVQPLAVQRILVAEDVEINREILRAVLDRAGHRLTFATTGAEALEAVQREPFDVVLMDVQMPVMDGVEATRRIRRLPPPVGQVPIIGLTANVMAREREQYLGAGMDDCLPKPIDWDQLHGALARIAGAAPAPDPVMDTAAVEAVLLDEHTLAMLRRMANDEELAELLRVGMQGYEDACAQIEQEGASADTVARQAHKLKGSAGTLGLAAISALAIRLEESALEGPPQRELIVQLRAAVAATRAELERRGLLPAVRAPNP
ncbi:ATP-binding protein [Ramlibacter sp. AN1133]|uniref:ATP-binding protein n=1 Tax=Ramlibacter sp. AN1133 TaxID=3133429 RepID=UPI0030C2244E